MLIWTQQTNAPVIAPSGSFVAFYYHTLDKNEDIVYSNYCKLTTRYFCVIVIKHLHNTLASPHLVNQQGVGKTDPGSATI